MFLQMKERELEYKKTIEQIMKDKEDLSHQMKLMQEGIFLFNMYVLNK